MERSEDEHQAAAHARNMGMPAEASAPEEKIPLALAGGAG